MAFSESEDSRLLQLELACSDLKKLLKSSSKLEENLEKMDKKLDIVDDTLTTASKRLAPLQSLAMATKALETRINRAVSPALSLLDSLKRSESLQYKLLELSSKLSAEKTPEKRLDPLINYVDCADELNEAINSIGQEGEPVIQKLQEVVEFLSRTKATDQYRTQRLRETLITLKALYENEVDAMKFEGLLDEALLNLQDEYESILQQLKHRNDLGLKDNEEDETEGCDELGSELEIEVLRRISETLAANDCVDICIDIFVKVRYRKAAKALMRLNPEYLRTYTPEQIDTMEWETLETAITLWIQHFQIAAKTVLVSEKKLCSRVLGSIMDGSVWSECFFKIADKIMAVFFRFGEGVSRSTKEPQKLFKLLDMFHSLEKLNSEFSAIFDGESGVDICTRFRELQKLLIHASSKVFYEFGLQIEGNSDTFPPPKDGSVPKIVRYAVNYLKFLASENYSASMAKVLRTEQIWKSGILSKPETDEYLLKDAISNVIEALQRNVESKRLRYKDKTLSHIFAMNTDWYIYMRTRNTEVGKLLGEQYMRKNYKLIAEESAYMYQKLCWGPLANILEVRKDEDVIKNQRKEDKARLARGKMGDFLKSLDEVSKRHRGVYCIPDMDLKEQIKEATMKFVLRGYMEFLEEYENVLGGGKSYASVEMVQGLLDNVFGGDGGMVKSKQRDLKDRTDVVNLESGDGEIKDFQRTGSNNSGV